MPPTVCSTRSHAPSAPPRRQPAGSQQGRQPGRFASVQQVLDGMTVPAVVYNAQQDIVPSKLAGRALFALRLETERPNFARFILDSRAHDYHPDWELAARPPQASPRRVGQRGSRGSSPPSAGCRRRRCWQPMPNGEGRPRLKPASECASEQGTSSLQATRSHPKINSLPQQPG
jgi:hypothetical protein